MVTVGLVCNVHTISSKLNSYCSWTGIYDMRQICDRQYVTQLGLIHYPDREVPEPMSDGLFVTLSLLHHSFSMAFGNGLYCICMTAMQTPIIHPPAASTRMGITNVSNHPNGNGNPTPSTLCRTPKTIKDTCPRLHLFPPPPPQSIPSAQIHIELTWGFINNWIQSFILNFLSFTDDRSERLLPKHVYLHCGNQAAILRA